MNKSQFTAGLVLASTSLALAGCGGDEPKAKAAAPVERSIFVSAVDCEASGKLSIDDCSKAIEKAVTAHEKTSPTYKSQSSCETAEGADKCERVADKIFRPKLVAYILDAATPPVAKPLYPTADGVAGFRNGAKEVLLASDDNLIFSKSAQDLYELLGQKKR